jgi:hypothetical protein
VAGEYRKKLFDHIQNIAEYRGTAAQYRRGQKA